MNHGNFNRLCRLLCGLCVAALGGGGFLPLSADEVVADGFVVQVTNIGEKEIGGLVIQARDAEYTTAYEVASAFGVPGTGMVPKNYGWFDIYSSFPETRVLGGEVNTYPNVTHIELYSSDNVLLDSKEVVYRLGDVEDQHIYVPEAQGYVVQMSVDGGDISTAGMTLEEFQGTNTEGESAVVMALHANRPTQSEIGDGATTKGTEMEALIGSHVVPTVGAPTASNEKSLLAFTVPGIEGSINLDPMENETIASVVPWMKKAVTFVMTWLYFWYLWKQFNEVMMAVNGAQQAKGNPVLGGTGAQATALLSAGAITLVIVAVPALWFAGNAIAQTPLATVPTESDSQMVRTAIYLFGLVFPYEYFFVLLATLMALLKLKILIVSSVQAVVRWVVF